MNAERLKNTMVEDLIARAWAEDVKSGDVTTNSIIDSEAKSKAVWKAKDQGVIAGLDIAGLVFKKLDAHMLWNPLFSDGDWVEAGAKIALVSGNARAILTAERIALNIAQRMSGIATQTHRFVEAIAAFETRILDTRKTVPGMRALDKQAVAAGGAENHRMGLFDLALIKDNHIAAAGGIDQAVQKVRKNHPDLIIEVETTNLTQVDAALAAGCDVIMLDNMSLKTMRKAVQKIGDRAKTEASGNITLKTVGATAETGVDYISVGALTHSVTAFDISQQLV